MASSGPAVPFAGPPRDSPPSMIDLHIGERADAERWLAESVDWAGVLSLGDPGERLPVGLDACARYLRREFHDVDREIPWLPRYVPANEQDIAAILEFFAGMPDGRVLVHCSAGISRSTAAAYIGLCQALGPGGERDALAAVIAARPQALPNRRIVRIADDLLGRGGEMTQVIAEHLDAWRQDGIAKAGVGRGGERATGEPAAAGAFAEGPGGRRQGGRRCAILPR